MNIQRELPKQSTLGFSTILSEVSFDPQPPPTNRPSGPSDNSFYEPSSGVALVPAYLASAPVAEARKQQKKVARGKNGKIQQMVYCSKHERSQHIPTNLWPTIQPTRSWTNIKKKNAKQPPTRPTNQYTATEQTTQRFSAETRSACKSWYYPLFQGWLARKAPTGWMKGGTKMAVAQRDGPPGDHRIVFSRLEKPDLFGYPFGEP